MLLGVGRLRDRRTIRADVVVAGAGAAGITLALALADTGKQVVVLESGGLEYDGATQALYDGTVSGSPYNLAGSRLRYLGGTTNHWGGWTRPLEPIDFERRDWIPNSGWPIGRAELAPFEAKASEIALGFPVSTYDWATWRADPTWAVESLVETDALTGAGFVVNPTRFGTAYRPFLEAAPDVTVQLGANVVGIGTDRTSGAVTRFEVATLDGHTADVVAADYVVALGGIDNARLLLASEDNSPGGIGNHADALGRYFMDHVEVTGATAVLRGPLPSIYLAGRPDLARAAITFTEELTRDEELASIAFIPVEYPYSVLPSAENTIRPEDVAEVFGAVEGTDTVISSLNLRAETEPNPDSRITLSEQRDAVGMPRVEVHRVLTDGDRRRLRRSVEVLGRELAASGTGWLRMDAPDLGSNDEDLFYGFHHMGSTRMGATPKDGVVDPDLRVHGVSNLFVAGSSVFPTSGFANPTLTIVALALRLADHLLGR